MNERRMREPFHTLMWKASIGYNDSWSQVDPEVLEKFAELIVRQCMDLVKDCYAEPESGQSPYQTVCASTLIEDHFGVTENEYSC